MKLKNCSFYLAIILVIITLPACKTTQTKPGENAMRIWVAPAYRANTNVNQSGHFYVNVQNESSTQVSAPSPSPRSQR